MECEIHKAEYHKILRLSIAILVSGAHGAVKYWKNCLLVVGLKDVEEVFGIAGDVAGPFAEDAVSVYGFDPLG